jgi:uncharacterized protein (DUF433 family)
MNHIKSYQQFQEQSITGGLSAGMTIDDIAKHHDVEMDELKPEYDKGIKVEMEHTKDPEIAAEIARDHLYEDPKYYTKLATIEEAKKPKGAPDWHESDAPDAEGRFKDLSPKDLAAWLIKTRKKDLKAITGSINQQIVFNRKEDPKYVEKMEKTRKEVYKQLGREDLLEEGFGSRLLDNIYDEYPAYMKDIKNLLRYIEKDKHIHPSMSREILSRIVLTKF